MPFPVLSTARLQLREITVADAPDLLRLHGNAEAMRWFGSDPPTDLAGAQRLVEVFAGYRQQPHPGIRWGLSLPPSSLRSRPAKGAQAAWGGPAEPQPAQPRLIGTCGLFARQAGWRKCTIGYELLPDHQGQGLMQEALQAAMAWGHEHMNLHRIEALVHPENLPSLRLLARLGLEQEGRLRDGAYWGGRFHDMLMLAHVRTPAAR